MIFELMPWDEDEYIISCHPENVPKWQSIPVGCTFHKSEGERVLRWLNSAWPTLFTLSSNLLDIERHEKDNE